MKTASIIIAAFIMLAITLNWFRYVPSGGTSVSVFDRVTRCYTYIEGGKHGRACPIDGTSENLGSLKKIKPGE